MHHGRYLSAVALRCTDNALRVNNEGRTVCGPSSSRMLSKWVRAPVGSPIIAYLIFRDGFQSFFVPRFVGEVVSVETEYVYAQLLQFIVVIGHVTPVRSGKRK